MKGSEELENINEILGDGNYDPTKRYDEGIFDLKAQIYWDEALELENMDEPPVASNRWF